jgi:myo-inositol-1-phosphate synthase
VIDAVRCAKLALDRKMGGALIGPSSYFMKSPPQQFTNDEARRRTAQFIDGVEELVIGAAERARPSSCFGTPRTTT